MFRATRTTPSRFIAVLGLILYILPLPSTAFSTAYCSSQNTGSGNGASLWTWQSNGWCDTNCKGQYAFGVILGANCWCSNYIPEDQEDTSDCSDKCPGFPSEKCGNADKNLYIYIKLSNDIQPSGTQSTSKPTSASVSPSSSAFPSSTEATLSSEAMTPSPAPPSSVSSARETSLEPETETVVQTVTATAPAVTLTPSETPSVAPTTLKTSITSTVGSSPPVTQTQIVTVSGVIVTQTVVNAPSSATPAPVEAQKKGSNVGAIVGGVIGGLALLGAIIGAIVFVLWRRRQQQRNDDDDPSGVTRNTSTMSKSGLLRGEKMPQYPPRINTTLNSKRSSRMLDNDSISPISGSDRRNSRPYIFDQRLNPSAIMTMDNPSRASLASMDDSRDYGRTLNVRNPDPDHQ